MLMSALFCLWTHHPLLSLEAQVLVFICVCLQERANRKQTCRPRCFPLFLSTQYISDATGPSFITIFIFEFSSHCFLLSPFTCLQLVCSCSACSSSSILSLSICTVKDSPTSQPSMPPVKVCQMRLTPKTSLISPVTLSIN